MISGYLIQAVTGIALFEIVDRLTRRWLHTPRPITGPLDKIPLVPFALSVSLIPFFVGENADAASMASVAGIWTFFCLGLVIVDKPLDAILDPNPYLCAWALSIAAPMTVFGQVPLDSTVLAQRNVLFGWLPYWGVVVQPVASATAVLSLAGWLRTQPPTLSPLHAEGMANGVLLAVTVVLLLGGGTFPGLPGSSPFQVGIFGVKLFALAWLTLALRNSRIFQSRFASKRALVTFAFANLLLTWLFLGGKSA